MICSLTPIAATALRIRAGQTVTVTRLSEGTACSIVAFSFLDPAESISSTATFLEERSIRLHEGSRLWSNRGRPLIEIVEGAAESFDFLLSPFSRYGQVSAASVASRRPGWFGSIGDALSPYGICHHGGEATFNLFLPITVVQSGAIRCTKPNGFLRSVRLQALEHIVLGFVIGTANEYPIAQGYDEISIGLE